VGDTAKDKSDSIRF